MNWTGKRFEWAQTQPHGRLNITVAPGKHHVAELSTAVPRRYNHQASGDFSVHRTQACTPKTRCSIGNYFH